MPTNDVDLIKSIRSMLLNDDGDIPMVQLQRNNPVNTNVAVAAAKENAFEGLTCNFGSDDSSNESSDDDDSTDDKSTYDERSVSEHDELAPTTSNAAGPLMNDECDNDKVVKDTSTANGADHIFENSAFPIIRQRSRSDSESSSSSSDSSSSSSSSSSDGSGSSSSSSSC